MSLAFDIGSTYSFKTYAGGILGDTFNNAKVLAVMDYTLAQQIGASIDTKHQAIYASLPTGTIDDPTQYQYILFQTEIGAKITLALQWIDQSTITLIQNTKLLITINGVQTGDDEVIRQQLVQMGFTQVTITKQ